MIEFRKKKYIYNATVLFYGITCIVVLTHAHYFYLSIVFNDLNTISKKNS